MKEEQQFSAGGWTGVWIGHSWQRDEKPFGGQPIILRKDFYLEKSSDCAVFRVSAGTKYALWINGRIVNYGPARSFPKQQSYDELEVSEYLNIGINSIAALIMPYSGVTACSPLSRLGFLLDGEIKYKDKIFKVFTNTNWKVNVANWFAPMDLYISLSVGMQEHYVGKLEPANWRTDEKHKHWQDAWYVGPVGVAPWKDMRPRSIPLLEEKSFKPRLFWLGNSSRKMNNYKSNLAIQFNNDIVEGIFVDLPDSEWIETNVNNLFVFDFEKTRLIRPVIDFKNISGRIRVELYYSNEMIQRPNAMRGSDTCEEGFCDSVVPVSGNSVWEAIGPRGFRFLSVKITGKGTCVFKLNCKKIDYPYPQKAIFACDNDLIQRIWEISAETLRSSTNDALVDTCSRENNLWTLDACVSARAAFYTFGETEMWRRCLELIAQGVDEDGIPKAIVPSEYSFMCLFDQALIWVTSCYDYYMETGDKSLLKDTSYAIKKLLLNCEKNITSEDYFVPPDFSWYFVDWASIDKRPYSLAINSQLLNASIVAEKIAEEIKNEQLKEISRIIINRLQKNLENFFDEEKGAFLSHIQPSLNISQGNPMNNFLLFNKVLSHDLHGNSLIINMEYINIEKRSLAAKYIAESINKPLSDLNRIGPGWTETILKTVTDYGYIKEAMSYIEKTYGRLVKEGAPTWGENFDAGIYNSAHGWGSCINTFIVERLIGIRPIASGFKKFRFDPNYFGILKKFKYSITTLFGNMTVSLEDGKVIISLPEEIEVVYSDSILDKGDYIIQVEKI